MLYTYLFSTVLGGLLLGISLFAGDHDSDGDLGHGGDGHDELGFFSLRVLNYFLAFGGLTGLLLTGLTTTGPIATGILSAGVGLSAGATARTVIRRALAAGASGTVRYEELVGRSAEVLIPFNKGETGQVRLLVKNSTIDLPATLSEDGELAAKEEVIVVEVQDGRALVTRAGREKA